MLSKIKYALIGFGAVWVAGLLFAACMDGMGRMAPVAGDFTKTWMLYWAAVSLASVIAATIAMSEA